MTPVILSLLAILTTSAEGIRAPDACSEFLPVSLQSEIARAYPGFRPVRVSDYTEAAIESESKYHAGSPCLGVASADVDGDGRHDFALLITSGNGRTLVIAAREATVRRWQLEKLSDFGDYGPGRSYVNVIEPGSYEDLGLNDEKEPGQVTRYTSTRPGFIAGGIESSGVAFFFTGKRWIHLWLSD